MTIKCYSILIYSILFYWIAPFSCLKCSFHISLHFVYEADSYSRQIFKCLFLQYILQHPQYSNVWRTNVCTCLWFCVCALASKGSHVNRVFGWSSKASRFGWRIETPSISHCAYLSVSFFVFLSLPLSPLPIFSCWSANLLYSVASASLKYDIFHLLCSIKDNSSLHLKQAIT